MKVLLVQDIDTLGQAGEIKKVADGYGRNYLIPRGLAVLASAGTLKQADVHRRRAEKKRERLAAEIAALSRAIERVTLTFRAKSGSTGRLYGSITTAEIADRLSEALEQEIDRRKILLDEPIKQLGDHKVRIRLSAQAIPVFSVIVESEDGQAFQRPVEEQDISEPEAE